MFGRIVGSLSRNMQIRNSYEKKSLCQIKDLKSIIDDKEEEICNLKHIVDCINKKQVTIQTNHD